MSYKKKLSSCLKLKFFKSDGETFDISNFISFDPTEFIVWNIKDLLNNIWLDVKNKNQSKNLFPFLSKHMTIKENC